MVSADNADGPVAERYQSFKEFYPFYLGEHSKPWTRRLHFTGTTLAMGVALSGQWLLVPVVGYGFAWVSHFFVEENRPATFKYPFYSLCGDLLMWSEMIRGRYWTGETNEGEREPLAP